MENLPKELQLCYGRAEITARIKDLSKEILTWIEESEKKTGQTVLAVCILRGAVFFFSDLLQAIPRSIEPAFCRTWGYTDEATQKSEVRVWTSDVEVPGRAVLLIDEICDTGATLRKLHDTFIEQGAVEVRSAVVVCRKVTQPKHFPDWVAFHYPGSEWFVGYGMDMANRFRNLPEIYRLVK